MNRRAVLRSIAAGFGWFGAMLGALLLLAWAQGRNADRHGMIFVFLAAGLLLTTGCLALAVAYMGRGRAWIPLGFLGIAAAVPVGMFLWLWAF